VRRDRRLLIPICLLLISLSAMVIQAQILDIYITSAIVDENWETMVQLFGVEAPAHGPTQFCFGRCAPELPFVAGWIGTGSFLAGLISLIVIWWKPKS
jgi:hypothetical protein